MASRVPHGALLVGGLGLALVGAGVVFSLAEPTARAAPYAAEAAYLRDRGRRRQLAYGNPAPYLDSIRAAVARHPELAKRLHVFIALLDQESGFGPHKESKTGAAGVAQFTGSGREQVRKLMGEAFWANRYRGEPSLANRLTNFAKPDAFDPAIAIEAAALFFAYLLRKRRGNIEAALTDYNAGNRAANLVVSAGSHEAAVPMLLRLPPKHRSQSPIYAPEVLTRAQFFATHALPGGIRIGGNALMRCVHHAA